MTKIDYRGARPANAGDDYHELWALRQALSLLDPKSGLYAVTVEGLKPEDESGKPPDTWDGVDCTFYYGDEETETPSRIVIAQLKYSSANPDLSWSIARLTQSTKKKGNNSVIRKLANAFTGLMGKYPDLAASGNLVVQLISNQPVDTDVIAAKGVSTDSEDAPKGRRRASSEQAREKLRKASGLNNADFLSFTKVLDFSLCGGGSRFSLEENVLATISSWTDDDARLALDHLMRSVRRKMMPEAKGEQITRHAVLSWMGYSNRDALYPCPSEIKTISPIVKRKISETISGEIISGKQYICIHGEGGCGKSTLIQEIAELLPTQSILITYDCYGGGRYLDADAFRHRPQDAFLQLTNDLALALRSPLLLTRSTSNDYPRIFKKRLERAAEVIASISRSALLVIVVDAADNSVIAANAQPTPEKSFIYDFNSIGDLPKNVCFIVTTRTGRLDTLKLPDKYSLYPIKGFEKKETETFARLYWKDASDSWIDDFHYLSRGNPRVQRYAIDYSEANEQKALSILRPKGKNLEDIFKEELRLAQRKTGQNINDFCAGVIALPRPIPISHLSRVIRLTEDQVIDICSDLAPGVIVEKNAIRFADEDFETFLRSEAGQNAGLINERIADHFLEHHKVDSYAACHIASAFLATNRRQGILDLVNQEQEPGAIRDPILRREVQSQRLRIAMKVCRETNNNADALLTLLYGAEAQKTDGVIKKMLIDNPDLAANFARDRSSRMILWDADEIENHGRLLFQLLAHDARQGDGISVREGYRQLRAWMQRRSDSYHEQKEKHPQVRPQGWRIEDDDIAAEIEAVLRIEDPSHAINQLLNWSPRDVPLRVALLLSFQLITSGETGLIEQCLNEPKIRPPWDLFLLTPLALAGKDIKLGLLETDLRIFLRYGLIRVDKLKNNWPEDDITSDYLEMILTACEVFLARGGDNATIIPVLKKFVDSELRRYDLLNKSQAQIIDLSMRAFTILERLEDRKPTLDSYFIEPQEKTDEETGKEVTRRKRSANENKQELERFIRPLLDIYDTRAQVIIGNISTDKVSAALQEAISYYHQSDYRLSDDFHSIPMRTRIAISLTRLLGVPEIRSVDLLENVLNLLGPRSSSNGKQEIKIYQNLALDLSLHPRLLSEVVSLYNRVKIQRSSADDKIEAFSNFARFLLPISPDDAEVIFKDAFQVAGEVNIEAIHEISLFKPFTLHAIDSMTVEERLQAAKNLAVAVYDASVRLEGYDHFPWENVARALTTLDFPFALAAAARWHDENIVNLDRLLPPILEESLSQNIVSPTRVLALVPLLDDFDEDLACKVIDTVKNRNGEFKAETIIECIARDELLRFGKGTRPKIVEKVSAFPTQTQEDSGFWTNYLIKATEFHKNSEPASKSFEYSPSNPYKQSRDYSLSDINLSHYRFISAEEIIHAIDEAEEVAQVSNTYVSTATILDHIQGLVQVKDRRAFLEALCNLGGHHLSGYDLGQALVKCAEKWSSSPAVSSWYRNRLLSVITEQLPSFCSWPDYHKTFLPDLLSKTGLENSQICEGLLDALEKHVDSFSVWKIYAVVGVIGQYCSSVEVASVTSRYAQRLVERISLQDREKWSLRDIPSNNSSSLARFLYSLLGDYDTRIRWRTAHAIRRFAKFDDFEVVDQLIQLYDKTSETSFRNAEAPFYWLAARLWLVIALDRIAGESPLTISKHGLWLLNLATNNKFPHILLRSFAKSAVEKLINNKTIELDLFQYEELSKANTSLLPRKKGRKSYMVGFDKYSRQEGKKRRFNFDAMDTLPNWYTSALRIFANVEGEEFLDAAESWIVERWNVTSNPWRWDDEPRKRHRGSDSSYYMTHDHGSRPIIERYHTYLEWHAMWCAIGELMQSKALSKESKDELHSYNLLLGEESLTIPGVWLSDILSPKPFEKQLWFGPQGSISTWIDEVSDNEFLAQLGLNDEEGLIAIDCSHVTRSYNFKNSVHIRSALVSTKTAAALVRSLQTVENSWDYRIPPDGDDLEIKSKPFTLIGWLSMREQVLGIEENDPLRYEIRRIESEPSEKVKRILNLSLIFGDQVSWNNQETNNKIMVYEHWGDELSGERPSRRGYDLTIRSSGWRLTIDKIMLKQFLEKSGYDLIVEVEINRSNKGDEYSRYDEEETKDAQYDRLFLLRRDGTVEGAEGRIGTWTLPG